MTFCLAACGNSEQMDQSIEEQTKNDTITEATTTEASIMEVITTEETAKVTTIGDATTEDANGEGDVGNSANDIDVNLTALSSAMVYSEVYNIMDTPGVYMGKTVRRI